MLAWGAVTLMLLVSCGRRCPRRDDGDHAEVECVVRENADYVVRV